MSTFLKLLPMELGSIEEKDFIEPNTEIASNETIIGDMPETSKRLYTLRTLLSKDYNQCNLDAHYSTDKDKKQELVTKAAEFKYKAEAINYLMWIAIRDEIGGWDRAIAVRTGFKVVEKRLDNDQLRQLFQGLFGG